MSTKVTQRKNEKPKSQSSSESAKKSDKANGNFFSSCFLIISLVILFSSIGIYYVNKPSSPGESRFERLNFIRRWGTFRSGVYFGLKRNEPSSMVAGLMWYKNILTESNTVPIRHLCDKFDPVKYIWNKHDFDSFGVQKIIDDDLILQQQLLFREDGWITRISVNSTSEKFISPVSLILYLATENKDDTISVSTPKNKFRNYPAQIGLEGSLSSGTRQFLSRIDFSDPSAIMYVTDFKMTLNPPLMYFNERIMQNLGIMRSPGNGKSLFVLQEESDASQGEPNFVAVQLFINRPTEMFFYLRESIDPYIDAWKNRFEADLMEKIFQFEQNFDNSFGLSEISEYKTGHINFAQSILSNMLGSIGYFHGYSLIKNGSNSSPENYGPLSLISAVPSRSYFPRGFLWDEGFHQLLISKIKPQLSREMIKNWLFLMDVNGWIPREVILGYEAISRVPREFIVQDISNANPPSLLLPIEYLFDSNQLDIGYLKSIFPLLEKWYNWFNTTQVGPKASTYRWRGRDAKAIDKLNPLTLTSGLDDYPRASHPSDSEIHLDLRCWMTLASRILFKIGKHIDSPHAIKYEETFYFLRDNRLLDSIHWSPENQMYCDYGMHSNSVELVRTEDSVRRVTNEKPSYQCVPELGYTSLFPMLLNLLDPDNPRLDSILNAIESPNHLWTPYGLRSISRQSRYYLKWNTLTDPPYWRGPIWININFLVLKSLKHYAKLDGPYKERAKRLHDELRENLVKNVFSQFEKTSFIYENYNDTTGEGTGVHPFTGWSALIILIMSDKY